MSRSDIIGKRVEVEEFETKLEERIDDSREEEDLKR